MALPAVLAALSFIACGRYGSEPPDPTGLWRAVLASPGGDLPFGLEIAKDSSGALSAFALNGPERVPFTTVRMTDRSLLLRVDQYDSEIIAALADNGTEMRGSWTRQAGKDRPSMKFTAIRAGGAAGAPRDGASPGGGRLPAVMTGSETSRFEGRPVPAGSSAIADVSGAWNVVFHDDDGDSPARAELSLSGATLLGTFLTPTGDYRYLEGDYGNGVLRLSCFDGSHAFLFVARATADGSLDGDFWSRSTYHATWKAVRAEPADRTAPASGAPSPAPVAETPSAASDAMPDPFAMTTLRNPTGTLGFTFPDLDGRPVSLSDPRFKGKVVLVDIFGSWCPNCNDQAFLLEEIYKTYHDRGLEIVGLAYEMTGDPARDAVFVRKYAERHHAAWPLLLAGTSDKADASATLPDLSGVLAFPTLLFVGRDGSVKAIHTGFAGPGTGSHYVDLKAKYVSTIEGLL